LPSRQQRAKQATACQAGNSVPSRQQRAKQTTACQAGYSVPTRQQRDLAVPRLGSNIAKQATVWKYG